ncbi:MAG: gcrA cell cycle regulator family protein [Alphaproteobacteria bacterium]|nr:gcrA cell cycle regulator family protein [Alphaproteobacteria bacterium]
MSWTEERVSVLMKLWGEGRTAAEIAKELGGVTRNAVIGKAHRLKLSNRVSPIQQNKKPSVKISDRTVEKKAMPAPANISKAPAAPVRTFVPDERKVLFALTDLGPRMCRWPIGDPREKSFGFCGDSCASGLPYCADHAKVAYQAAGRTRTLNVDTEPRYTAENEDQEEILKKASA